MASNMDSMAQAIGETVVSMLQPKAGANDTCILRLSAIRFMLRGPDGRSDEARVLEIYESIARLQQYKVIRDGTNKLVFPAKFQGNILASLRNLPDLTSAILTLRPTSISSHIDTTITMKRKARLSDNRVGSVKISNLPSTADKKVIAQALNNYLVRTFPQMYSPVLAEFYNDYLIQDVKLKDTYKKIKVRKKGSSSIRISAKGFHRAKYMVRSIDIVSVDSRNKLTSKDNWLNLVGEINSRLAGTLIEMMVHPRLQNRTGGFAHSARVTSVRTATNIANSRARGINHYITYTYNTRPYGVFDPMYGTPRLASVARDPKRLISEAINKILKDLGYSKFRTNEQYHRFYTSMEGHAQGYQPIQGIL